MSKSNKIIIFSHGFGVRKDSRGMFTEIASWFPDFQCIFFDYNKLPDEHTIVVSRFLDQAKRFLEILLETRNKNPQAKIFIVTHSQGAIPVSLAETNKILIEKIVLLAPATSTDINKTIEYFKRYPNTSINLDGESVLERRDGTKTIVPKEFWEDKKKYDPVPLYNNLSLVQKVSIIFADGDDVVINHPENLSKDIEIFHVNADHNFNSEARGELKKVLINIL